MDIGGETLRFLGLETAGASQPLASDLAKIAIALCEKSPDLFPVEELSTTILNSKKFNEDEDSIPDLKDFIAAQLLVERTLVNLYRDIVRVSLFGIGLG